MQKGTMLSSSERATSPVFLLAGVVAPILFVVVFTVDGALRPGYSPVRQMISDLGAEGANTWIQNANFMVTGLLLLAFAIGFYPVLRQVMAHRPALISTVLLSITGAGLINDGIFTEDSSGVSLHGVVHVVGFLIIFGALIFALFIIGRHLRRTPTWRGYGWYTTATAYIALLLLILVGPIPSHGITNRLLVIVTFAWYVVISCRLLVLTRAVK